MPIHPAPVGDTLRAAVRAAKKRIWLLSPAVERASLESILTGVDTHAIDLRLLVRLTEHDLIFGITDATAMIRFIELGGTLRLHPKNLHAKAYIMDDVAFAASGNISKTGLDSNVETLYDADSRDLEPWFLGLWNAPGTRSIELPELQRISQEILKHPARQTMLDIRSGLKDLAVQ